MKKFIKDSLEDASDALFAFMIIVGAILMLILIGTIAPTPASAQDYIRKGNTFIMSPTTTRDTLVTGYTIIDSKGVERPIIINRANGHCYVLRKSSKTGKQYRQWLKASLSESIAKELNITYVPPKSKK